MTTASHGSSTSHSPSTSSGRSAEARAARPSRVLYRGGRVRSPVSPFATSMLTDGDTVAWVGTDEVAATLAADLAGQSDAAVVELDDALITPAFVDAHVHATAAGLALGGLDLAGAPTLAAALDALSAYAKGRSGSVILGTGWDETAWPERRAPTAAEIDRAAGGAGGNGSGPLVYLARADVHSAVVSSALAARAGVGAGFPGWSGTGRCLLDAHHAVRSTALASVGTVQCEEAQRRTRARAAELGIAALHEMAGPQVSSEEDLVALLVLAHAEPGPEVSGYWSGEISTARRLGVGCGGDLFVDGSIGSHTAALGSPYTDRADEVGVLQLDADDVREQVLEATAAGLQIGFHVIGDAAIAVVLDGLEAAAERVGLDRIVGGRHRLEHCEMAGPDAVRRMARLGVVASVQPAFDARWGGADGMYAQRLGPDRAAAMNPFAGLAAAGVVLALSSDAPVTPLDPWGGVRAAVRHHAADSALSARAAFSAATRGGWRAARAEGDGSGELAPGRPASFAVWAVPDELVVQVPDGRIAAWSTDPRAAVAGLPNLSGAAPSCLRTVVRGRPVFVVDEPVTDR
ncbi:MAG: amidohydrolase [Frankia sp.]